MTYNTGFCHERSGNVLRLLWKRGLGVGEVLEVWSPIFRVQGKNLAGQVLLE
jgi:hypothetical protein